MNKRSQNSWLGISFLQWKTPTFLFTKKIHPGSSESSWIIDCTSSSCFGILHSIFFTSKKLDPFPHSYSSNIIIIFIIISWIIVPWLGHCHCASSYSLIGCGILIVLWLSHTPFGRRKLPTFLICLINLYLLLPALFATKWCVTSA